MLSLSTKKYLGLLAVIMSIISISSFIIANSLASNYHCDDPSWLAKSEWKNGAHPAMAPDIHMPALISCKAVVGNIWSGAFFLGVIMPWFIFSLNVMIWRTGMNEDDYKQSPGSEKLCQLHLNQKIASNLWSQQFTLQYENNLGKCDLCSNDALGLFIKKTPDNTVTATSTENEK